jgi:hypothetical protein
MWIADSFEKTTSLVHHQIEKALGHRDIRNVRAPHLIDPLDRDPAEQVRVDLMLRCRLAGVGALVDRHQPHQTHEPLDPLAIDLLLRCRAF